MFKWYNKFLNLNILIRNLNTIGKEVIGMQLLVLLILIVIHSSFPVYISLNWLAILSWGVITWLSQNVCTSYIFMVHSLNSLLILKPFLMLWLYNRFLTKLPLFPISCIHVVSLCPFRSFQMSKILMFHLYQDLFILFLSNALENQCWSV